MARTIRNTPILYGKDAEAFLQEINTPIPLEERRRRRQKVEEGANRFRELVAEIEKKMKEKMRNDEQGLQ